MSKFPTKSCRRFRDYADVFEQVGIDEAYLDVTQRVQGSFEAAEELAQKMKDAVKKQHGLTFYCGYRTEQACRQNSL